MEGLEPPPKESLILGAPLLGVGVPGLAEGLRPNDAPEPPPILRVMVGFPDIVAVVVVYGIEGCGDFVVLAGSYIHEADLEQAAMRKHTMTQRKAQADVEGVSIER